MWWNEWKWWKKILFEVFQFFLLHATFALALPYGPWYSSFSSCSLRLLRLLVEDSFLCLNASVDILQLLPWHLEVFLSWMSFVQYGKILPVGLAHRHFGYSWILGIPRYSMIFMFPAGTLSPRSWCYKSVDIDLQLHFHFSCKNSVSKWVWSLAFGPVSNINICILFV